MGIPIIPDVSRNQALTNLLESIALEEAALAHLINAEAEKVQALAARMDTKDNPDAIIDLKEITDFQKNVARVIQTVIKMQMLLQFKLENVLEAKLHFPDDDYDEG
jgi:hypothetical protein